MRRRDANLKVGEFDNLHDVLSRTKSLVHKSCGSCHKNCQVGCRGAGINDCIECFSGTECVNNINSFNNTQSKNYSALKIIFIILIVTVCISFYVICQKIRSSVATLPERDKNFSGISYKQILNQIPEEVLIVKLPKLSISDDGSDDGNC